MRLACAVLLIWLCSRGPAPLAAQPDTAFLTQQELLSLVAEHHPLARRAALLEDRAAAYRQLAAGNFDPKAFADVNQKYFGGKRYWNLLYTGVKVPTWYGIELQAAYETNGGIYRDASDFTNEGGIYSAGLSLNLARGLLIDRRRAELRRARIGTGLAAAEYALALNELLYDAGVQYWDWTVSYGNLGVAREAVRLAEVRYRGTLEGAEIGEQPAIDTLEAGIQLRNRRLELAEARLEEANERALLSVYCWLDGEIPLQLEPTTVPAPVPVRLPPATAEHPLITAGRLKLDQLEVDRRLAAEQLKPEVQLDYNLLEGRGGTENGLSPRDYKWGLRVNSSLFLRKERAKLRLAELKLSEETLALSDKQQSLRFKQTVAAQNIAGLVGQLDLAERNVADYRRLLDGERRLFAVGESSLFLVNSRENKYLDSRRKLLQLRAKAGKAELSLGFANGQLPQLTGAGPREQ